VSKRTCRDCGLDYTSCVCLEAEEAFPLAHKARNVGTSDYALHKIQPWDIWREYSLNPWDADIVKRVLRTKQGDSRKLDYEKIIHICQERIAQLDGLYDTKE